MEMHFTPSQGVPDWQDGADDTDEVRPTTNDAYACEMYLVKPSQTIADVARCCYGSNNVVNRLKLELANNGNITGWIKVPK